MEVVKVLVNQVLLVLGWLHLAVEKRGLVAVLEASLWLPSQQGGACLLE